MNIFDDGVTVHPIGSKTGRTTIGLKSAVKHRFDELRAGQKHDVILTKMMDLWQGMSEGERGAVFDRIRDAKAAHYD
jgi:hypothetical protein